ncbi:MAG: hypothetical protein FWH55_12810 [Oscillospiraceae bacterium]|nr:hypothetical protein [Oscillospiraceae bacterium]
MTAKLMSGLMFTGLCFTASCAVAGEVPVQQCPPTLTVKKEVTSPVNNGWKVAISDTPLHLSGVGVAAGEYPHEQTGPDKPVAEERLPNGDVTVHYDHPNWAMCIYHKSDVVLIQNVPKSAVRCETRVHYYPDSVSFKCFDTPRATVK